MRQMCYLFLILSALWHHSKSLTLITKVISASQKHLYQSAIASGNFCQATPLWLCPSCWTHVETAMESTTVCPSIIDSYRHTICMQMTPHSVLNWAVNGVPGAICHSVDLTRPPRSLTCLSRRRPCASYITAKCLYVCYTFDHGEWSLNN